MAFRGMEEEMSGESDSPEKKKSEKYKLKI